MHLHVAYPRPLCHRFLRLSFVFYDKKSSQISPHFAIFCYVVFALIARCRHLLKTTHNCAQLRTTTHNYAQLRTMVDFIVLSIKVVFFISHGFFITINSMILYFKHIIHIDDFPFNGHPPIVMYYVGLHRYNIHLNSCHFSECISKVNRSHDINSCTSACII